jgi:7-carboxy-7-deazaguanine synthase
MKYKINDIFYSIQGEGFNTGKPFIFVKFSGCNLKCSYCDTNTNSYKEFTLNELMESIKKISCKNILLTGGEPA